MDMILKEDLEDGDAYEGRCGEILFTSKGYVVFNCTFCKNKFKEVNSYLTHVSERHGLDLQYLNSDPEYDLPDTEFVADFVKCEEFFSDNEEVQHKDHVSISTEKDDEEFIQMSEIKSTIMTNEKEYSVVENKSNSILSRSKKVVHEFQIPTETREVRKRILLNNSSNDDEERKFKCPICGAAFKDKYNMRGHVRRHSKEKRYQCPECPKKFYTGSEVNVHMRFHTGERKFLCSDCGKSLSTNAGLLRHIKRHKNQKDVQCQVCEKKFFDSSRLKEHMLSHSSDRKFICPTCNATFVRRKSLINHQKLHENKREFKCKVCGAGFNQKAGLFCHMKCTHKTTK